MPEPKATHISIQFDDGSTVYSYNASDAAKIWDYWENCNTFMWTHGQEYKGPILQRTPPTDVQSNVRADERTSDVPVGATFCVNMKGHSISMNWRGPER